MTTNKPLTIYFMRHGETYLNKYERMQGWSNAPLTERGAEVTVRSGRGLAHVRFDAVYTSDLARTVDTAKIILAQNRMSDHVTITQMPEFREVFFGSFEGLDASSTWEQVRLHAGLSERHTEEGIPNWQAELAALKELDVHHESEDYMSFWMRVERGLVSLLQTHKNQGHTILVVAHGMAINMMLSAITPNYYFDGHLLNASVSIATYHNGQFDLNLLNSTKHFI